jgi:hypothetical protein
VRPVCVEHVKVLTIVDGRKGKTDEYSWNIQSGRVICADAIDGRFEEETRSAPAS